MTMTVTQARDAATDGAERKVQQGLSGIRFVSIIRRFLGGPRQYDPARHYMRGPGPKCREKAGLSVRAL